MSVDHVFIDLFLKDPTSIKMGLEHGSVALVRTDARGKVIAATCATGHDFLEILEAIDSMVKPFSAQYIVVAVNANEKRNALAVACGHAGEPAPFKGRAWLDFGQVAWPLALAELVPNRSLETVGAHFHVRKSAHAGTLTGDVAYLAEVYWSMARSYRAGLMAEGALRRKAHAIGGEAVSTLRRMVGI